MRRHVAAAAGLLAAFIVARSLRELFTTVTVDGDSMMPTLAPGDRVLVRRARASRLRAGQVVVVEKPDTDGAWATPLRWPAGRREWMIKRLAAVPGDVRPAGCLPESADLPGSLVPPGKLVVLGDNPAWSQDSRQLGYFPGERLLGVVVRQMSAALASDRQPQPAYPAIASYPRLLG
jgi:signal peptidase I